MKGIWRFVFGKPKQKKESKKERKKEKKSLSATLAASLIGILLTTLELKWSEDLWKPDF